MVEKLARSMKWHERFSFNVITYTELFFYILGRKVATKPKTTILACWIIVFASSIGFVRYHQEKNPMKLWVPPESSFVKNSEWLMHTFQRGYRVEAIIVKAPDVLTPEVLNEVGLIDIDVKRLKTASGVRYGDICFKIPDISPTNDVLYKLSFDCDMLKFLDRGCYEQSILELWDYNLKNVTKQDILNKVNKYKIHPIYGNMKHYEDLLGGIVRNETGHIVSATTLHNMWMVNVNFSAIDMDKSGNMAGTADWASEDTLDWELVFKKYMKSYIAPIVNFTMYFASARSFGDISNSTMFQDLDILTIGAFVMVIYVQIVISKFNWIEARVILGSLGLLTIGMAFIVGCGLCSLLGVSYGPVHTSLPFLLMGLGVDDMFIILACWEELTEEQKKLPLHERIGTMLKHAGVSITVTTVTDILAFLVGSLTIVPSLKSYCLYAAVGVLMTFIFSVTFFIACFAIDEKRIIEKRNCCCPCIKNPNYERKGSHTRISKRIFHALYSRVILTWPGKLLVIFISIILFGFSIESIFKLEQRFDPMWFVPAHTHLAKYIGERRVYYPKLGAEAGLYTGAINYTQEIGKLANINAQLENISHYVTGLNSWITPFHGFVKEKSNKDIYIDEISDHDFNMYLTDFLFTDGSRFQGNFQFEKELKCGQPAPKIQVSSIDFRFRSFSGPEEHLPAMNTVMDLTHKANFSTGDKVSFVWSKMFASWITDEIIDVEVLRNLGLALGCVMICTALLIVNFQTCFWIFLCVLLTMINVCGFMQRWGMTIDVTSCIGLQLAIGLCVDYATHIGHTFLTIPEGSRNERALKTVSSIGAAVLCGGFSTLIGVSMLSRSDAYAFKTFFKIFFMVVLFGLYHGVVLLPVILSWIGPKPYRSHRPLQQTEVLH